MLSCLTVSFRCGVVYSRGNRTPEREKKQTSVYLIKREMKNKFLYVPGTYISPFVVALAAGVNSNPSSRETFFLRTANPRQDPNSCIHYDVIWRYYSSTCTGGRHQVMQQQTGSEPLNRCPPDLLVHTSHIHTVVHQSTGGRHQVMQQQTGSEPPDRYPPELLVKTNVTHPYSSTSIYTRTTPSQDATNGI